MCVCVCICIYIHIYYLAEKSKALFVLRWAASAAGVLEVQIQAVK